jgi:hypothetical protein
VYEHDANGQLAGYIQSGDTKSKAVKGFYYKDVCGEKAFLSIAG